MMTTLLDGGEGADVLKGFGGNDILDGGDEADTMWGGTGDDIYAVDNAGDVVTEFAGEGSDTVWASIHYTLGDQVENLIAGQHRRPQRHRQRPRQRHRRQ